MPRRRRIHVPGAFYHVTLRGNHRQKIFFRRTDRQLLDKIVAETIDRYSTRLHAYCYMTNHLHFLFQVSATPLGRVMMCIASRYARTVQARLDTTGHLFERRYHPIVVDADEYLLAILRYIHRNPVEAGIVTAVKDYPWSSHHAYLGADTQTWVTTGFALRLFHSERGKAIAAYQRFVEGSTSEGDELITSHLNSDNSRILGSDDFLAKLLSEAGRHGQQKTLDELVANACRRFSVSCDELRSRSRQRRLTRVRAWVAYQAAIQEIASVSEVARAFNRSEGSLRQSVKCHFRCL